MNSRQLLPIYGCREELVQELKNRKCCVVISETGSGKTTQIPQYIVEENINGSKCVAVTQPRRVAAVSLAQRVASEMGVEVGTKVGYIVRFEHVAKDDTRLLYMTDGILLREAMHDPDLNRYSVIVLDEAHERTVRTDILFGVVKQAMIRRRLQSALRVIVMSATMNVDEISNYFDRAPVLYIEGRQYPIQLFYTPRPMSDYVHAAIVTIFQIHREKPAEEAILVFLTGAEEIEGALHQCRAVSKLLPSDAPRIVLYALYAAVPFHTQMKIFKPPTANHRKVILTTNIAETSVTIPGVRHVIDCGKVKARIFEPQKRLDMLKVVCVSQAQACQRTGRAGRDAPGTCYRLYPEKDYHNFQDHTVPEIKRCSLTSVVLELLSMKITNLHSFDFIDKPSDETLSSACQELAYLGATVDAKDLKLTPLGRQMVKFPVDPKLAKILIAASDIGCLEEALVIVALMSLDQSIFVSPPNKREEAEKAHLKFSCAEGDHLSMLRAFRAFKANPGGGNAGNQSWSHQNYVNSRQISNAENIRAQLRKICYDQDFNMKSCGSNFDLLRKAICAGLFMQCAELQPDGRYKAIDPGLMVQIHPSSFMFRRKPGCVVYNELVCTNQLFIRDVLLVDPKWLESACPRFFAQKRLLMI